MIRVLVVDDSALIRRILTDILNKDKDISVIGAAKHGKEALEKIETLNPDIITLDIEMPIMDGMTTLKHIVSKYKLPVIMISTLSQEGADLTLKALDEGAVDFLAKPTNVFRLNQQEIIEDIIQKVKSGSKLKPSLPKQRINPISNNNKISNNVIGNEDFKSIIAIGTSTGGPRALQSLIPSIPEDISASIVIVQHMPPKFTKSLAERLNAISKLNVKEAEQGEVLKKGWAYIAPGDYHMRIEKQGTNLVIKLNQDPKVMGLRPTVDIMMSSVSRISNYSKIGIILTGMGSDGSKGIIEMKKNKSYTIAQDESSSVVYGMPRAAIEAGGIDEILSLDEIPKRIINKVEV